MTIGIDIDDTLTYSFEYFMPFVAEFFGVDVQYLKEHNISYSNLPDEWRKRELEFCKKYYDSVVVDTTFKPDAAEFVAKLKSDGHKIFIITARTAEMYTNPYETTEKELDKNGIRYDNIICSPDKDVCCVANGIDVLIDDSVSNCEKARRRGIDTILFTSPANKDIKTDLMRADSWDGVYKIIKEKSRGAK